MAVTSSETTLQEAIDAFLLERKASEDPSAIRRWQWELNRFATVTEK